jgi:hypothetical protein
MRSSWRECTTLHSPMWKTTVGESSFTVSLATLAEFFLVGFTLIVLSISSCSWSSSLKSVKFSLFWNSLCKIHPILKHRCYSSLDISRIPVKLRLVTGTYVLQTKRIKYYRNETDDFLIGLSRSYFRSILLTHINQLLLDSSFTVGCLLASFFSVFFFALMTDVI